MSISSTRFSKRGMLLPVMLASTLVLGACTSYGVIANAPLTPGEQGTEYSLREFAAKQHRQPSDLTLAVAFSGGGTRAAALSYGVLQELRDTKVLIDGKEQSLLEAINVISSVSGGSFTSAYYGLYGNRIFEDYEKRFLTSNVQGALLRGLLNPARWFSSKGRTEMAVAYYKQLLFGDATFGDLARRDGPMILINSSDLATGGRFSFVQEYFGLLCSDLSSFPLARAVTASSAVPVLFEPVVVENYSSCPSTMPPWLAAAKKRDGDNAYLSMVVRDDLAYQDKVTHKFAQFVDGGITDNLGLLALLDAVQLAGGARDYAAAFGVPQQRRIAIISVNAAADAPEGFGKSNRAPTLEETMSAVTNVQIHRYNVATLQHTQENLDRWSRELSTPGHPVTSYFIRLSFEDVTDVTMRRFLNEIPTSFVLDEEQVARLITTGRELLRNNPDYQRLLSALRAQASGGAVPPNVTR
ncbi:patatin-like phospholipase family protein [Variovorax sp. J22P168]|uniref:patatin-like phospholipase family protein n=1 Tax=Variovorax jilinensis TaxID=3053513 RepID=UPI0025771CEE|nr:patatin-like phospholipase family protein [Variovorax sp. J22P168]MDM0014900.1 patatin-like phospholipase family protein [Variovorax sp. J22P168]